MIDVMQENISKVIERGERLDDLQDKSGESQRDTEDFSVSMSQMKVAQTPKGVLSVWLLTHMTLIRSFQRLLHCFFLSNNRSKT